MGGGSNFEEESVGFVWIQATVTTVNYQHLASIFKH